MSTVSGSAASTPQARPTLAETLVQHQHVSDPDPLRNLIVNYLPPMMDEMQVAQLFSQFGPIDSVKIIYDKITGESRGYGFVKFEYFFSATYAISCLNRFSIAGKKLKVAYANAEQAKEALAQFRATASSFTPQQQLALQTVMLTQSMLASTPGAVGGVPAVAAYASSSLPRHGMGGAPAGAIPPPSMSMLGGAGMANAAAAAAYGGAMPAYMMTSYGGGGGGRY